MFMPKIAIEDFLNCFFTVLVSILFEFVVSWVCVLSCTLSITVKQSNFSNKTAASWPIIANFVYDTRLMLLLALLLL